MQAQMSAGRAVVRIGRRGHFRFRPTPVQLGGWAVLIVCGLIQAWWTRHNIFSDGISYLDIAGNYLRGDWKAALNEYWSPLPSWILAITFKLFHPPPYWQVATLHAINFAAFLGSLVFLELFVHELLRYRGQARDGLSSETIRIAAYASLFIAGLWHITLGHVSPDMLTMATLFLIAYLQLRIENGGTRPLVYILFGGGLALGFLSRAAFAPVLPVYIGVLAISLWVRGRRTLMPLVLAGAAVVLLCGPFVVALSLTKGHFTWGAAGPPNYAWEVDGAPRSVHWHGQPPELGKPIHPTRRVLEHPATYEFGSPVPGTYPPWYEPSYWYAGISPRFIWKKQLNALSKTLPFLAALFLASPVALPCFGLIAAGNWRKWLSRRGILAYWFLLLPLLAYMGLYTLVFIEKRYMGAPLAIVWICLVASVSVSQPRLRRFADFAIPILCILFVGVIVSVRMRQAIRVTFGDLVHGRESEWNLHWILAQRFQQLGLKRGDRIAFVGNAIDSEWARQLGVQIVAEVPVIWDRDNRLSRRILLNYTEPDAYWYAPAATRARVLEAFRRAGASLVVTDKLPTIGETQGWRRVLAPNAPHLPYSDGQYRTLESAGYLRIGR